MIKIDGKWKHTEEEKGKISKRNVGKINSKTTRKKISEWRKEHFFLISYKMKQAYINNPYLRIEQSIRMQGDKNPMKRKEVKITHLLAINTPEHKKLRSEIFKKVSARPEIKKLFIGSNNPNWVGGISRDGYPYLFNKSKKEIILKRDNYKCQVCGDFGKCCHHIDYNKSNIYENNLITLCRTCHAKTSFNRPYWTSYFQTLIIKDHPTSKPTNYPDVSIENKPFPIQSIEI